MAKSRKVSISKQRFNDERKKQNLRLIDVAEATTIPYETLRQSLRFQKIMPDYLDDIAKYLNVSTDYLKGEHAITLIRKKPNETPEFALIDNTVEALREQVEGFFEIIGSKEHIGNFVVNTYYNRERDECEEEGEFNCSVEGHNFRGTILYIGPLAGDFEDAPREAIDLLLLQRQHNTLGKKRWLW